MDKPVEPDMGTSSDFEVLLQSDSSDENPRNWSTCYKAYVLLTISWTTLMVVVGATSYTSGLFQMQREFQAESVTTVALGLTSYLLGWVFGSLFLAPLSEMYGRRWIYLISVISFDVLMIPCALARSLSVTILLRFFAAVAGSGMIALSPGTISDIASEEQRALAYSVWSLGPFTAPALGPVMGGFVVETLGWRWNMWIVIIGAGLGFLALTGVRESYAPVLLRRKAATLRRTTGDSRWWSQFDSVPSLSTKLWINLSRPFKMALLEPMLILWNAYIGLIYGVLYLSFTLYPIVFQDLRQWSEGTTGLSFLGLGVGSFLCIISEPLIRRFIYAFQIDKTAPQPEATISIVCIAGLLLPVGEFWFAWTSAPPVHWIWPILAGVPFGAGATANFIYALNYLAQSYGLYAASTMVGNTVWRCILGGTLPLAAPALYERLGIHWAGSLLAFLLLIMAVIPFLFYKYGARIRARSLFIARARREEERMRGGATLRHES